MEHLSSLIAPPFLPSMPIYSCYTYLYNLQGQSLYCTFVDPLSIHVIPTNPTIGKTGTTQFTAIANGVNMYINGRREVVAVFLIKCQVLMEQC